MTASGDRVELSIIGHAFQAIAEEMGANLVRSAFSTVIREARDCSTALLDTEGRVVAVSAMLPMQTVALSMAFEGARRAVDLRRLTPTSAIILNDPHFGGQHLNDLILFQPIFCDGALIGYSGSTAHHIDIGGATAGVNTGATELIQEGLVLPPLLFDVGSDWHGGMIEKLIARNVRMPEVVLGDLNAQFAANHIGIVRVTDLVRRRGADTVRAAMTQILDYGERRMRNALRSIPNGRYSGEAKTDPEEVTGHPITIRVEAEVTDGRVHMDFAGSDPQVRSMMNCPLASSMAAALSAVRCLISERDIPWNDGCNRAVTAAFPAGSVLNPHSTAPVRARATVAYRAFDAVHSALAAAMPERVPAEAFNTTTALYLTQSRPDGSTRVHADIFGGGFGAAPNYDGASAVDCIMSNCRATPVEAVEQIHDHLRIRAFSLLRDSGGAGRWRGGMGFLREFEILDDDVVLNLYSDRFATEPKGLAGGANGTCGALTITREGKTIDLPPTGGAQLQTGDIVSLRMGGGAGWGQPEQRQIDAIEQDIAEGLISAQQASADYGYNLSERDAKQLEADRSAAAHPQGFTAEVQSVRVKMREREST